MVKEKFYSVKIDSDTYDVITANTDFYEYVGDRIYLRLDMLVVPEHRDRLQQVVNDGAMQVINWVTKNKGQIICLTMRESVDDASTCSIRIIELYELFELVKQQDFDIDVKNTILSLYNDYYFFYNPKTDLCRVFAQDRHADEVFNGKLESLKEQLSFHSSDDSNKETIDSLITSISTGQQEYQYTFEKNIITNEEANNTYIHGISSFEGSEYKYAAGYIRISNNATVSAKHIVQRDYLTGLLAKSEITEKAINLIDTKRTSDITLCIIDIDYFKNVNDIHGHATGDAVLKEVASIIESEVGDTGECGRIGGDEFMVLFYNAPDMEIMRERLRSIKNTVADTFCRGNRFGLSITLSMGCAAFPKDADNYENLFLLADFALYRAKEKGRNRYVIYDVEKHGTPDEIRNSKVGNARVNSRGNMSPQEVFCVLADQVLFGKGMTLDKLVDGIVENMAIQRVVVYAGSPYQCINCTGTRTIPGNVLNSTVDYLYDPDITSLYDETGMFVVDNTKRFETTNPELYEKLAMQSVLSFIQIRFKDRNGVDAILSIEAVLKRVTWNKSYIPCYRLLAKLLSTYAFPLRNQ